MDSRNIRTVPMRDFKPPDIKPATVGMVILLLLIAAALWSSIFTVAPEEVGVVLTFGKYTREVGPGLQFKLPSPLQSVTKVPVQRQLKQEFGFRTEQANVRSRFTTTGLEGESLMLTGDLNVAVVEWTTQFRVNDPYKFLFRVRNLGETFRDMNEAVMRAVVGDRSVTEVLTVGRQEIASEVERTPAGAVRPVRDGIQDRAGRAAGRQPAGRGQALVQRGQPGAAGARDG